MTFNTTSLPLFRALKVTGALREYEAVRPLSEQKRWLLVTPHIHDLLCGKTEFGVFPQRSAEILFATYAAGHLVTVSRKKTNERPDLEQIEGFDEVWAFCPRVPKPGWRVLGRFYQKDVFLGLRAWDKHKLAGSYAQAAWEIASDWKQIFGSQSPHRGAAIADYLSGVFKDVDEAL